MKKITFHLLDVFAKNKYGGNQLAVFIDLENKLNSAEMLQMAKEINFAESIFITQRINNNEYAVRIFTTESEIPFAGHPTIGTSYIIAKYLMGKPEKEIVLRLMVGDIKVTLSNTDQLDDCLFQMTQTQPAFSKIFNREEMEKQLGVEKSIINDEMPIQEISTGLPFVIVPVKNLKSIEEIKLNPSGFKNFLIKNKIYKSNSPKKISTSLLFYTHEIYEKENDYNVRMFCLEDDILKEDAATGSANGCFLAYLLKYKSANINAKVEQGFQMDRKSYLYLEGELNGNIYDIKVGGHSKIVAKGEWIV